ncbi:MAG: hypothetical protein LKE33_09900 [Acidaminococcus sp.]|nr:hypothetical protein [Acidaminococcus sp.]MCI2116439.1 hypothetical protein [Acidaminococcus sp.]
MTRQVKGTCAEGASAGGAYARKESREAVVACGDGKDKTFYPSTVRTFFDAALRH